MTTVVSVLKSREKLTAQQEKENGLRCKEYSPFLTQKQTNSSTFCKKEEFSNTFVTIRKINAVEW